MRHHLPFAGLLVAALLASGCHKKSETEGSATPAEQNATPDANPLATVPSAANEAAAPDFVAKAGASDMFEIAAAKLALQRSNNADVKAFATKMREAHTKSTADLRKAIGTTNNSLTLPTALPSDLQGKLDDLQSAKPADFDKKYAESQVDAHQDALNLLQRYAQDGDAPAIRDFAAKTAPVVQQHLDMGRALRDGLKR